MNAREHVHLREAHEADWPALADVYGRAYRQAFGEDTLPEDVLGHLIPQIVEETLWLAELEGRVVGFISLYRPTHFIRHFYVDPEFQGRGVGARLFDHITGLTGADFSLKCSPTNVRARRYYEARGMNPVERGTSEGQEWILYKSS